MSMYRKNYAVRLHKKSRQTVGLVQVGESSSCVVPWRQSGIRYVKIPGVRVFLSHHRWIYHGLEARDVLTAARSATAYASQGQSTLMYSSLRQTCLVRLVDCGPERMWLVRLRAMSSNVLEMSPSFAESTMLAMSAGGRPKYELLITPCCNTAPIASLNMWISN